MLDMPCDVAWSVGDRRRPGAAQQKSHGWVLKSSLPSAAGVEQHLEAVLERLKPSGDRMARVALDAELNAVCSVYTDRPTRVKFDRHVVEDLALLGVTFGVDVYFLPSGDDISTDIVYQDVEAYVSVDSLVATRKALSSHIGTEGDPLTIETRPTENAGLGTLPPVWLLRSPLPQNMDIEMHVDAILQRSRKFRDRLAEASQVHDLWVWCIVKTNDRVVVELGPDHIKGISRLGAGLALDYRISL